MVAFVQPIQVKNPITGEILSTIPVDDREAVYAAVERARAAQADWAALSVTARGKIVRRWQELCWRNQDHLLRVIRAETGKTDVSAYQELAALDNIADYYVRRAPGLLRPQSRRAAVVLVQNARVYYKPHGVVGVISPWNYPFLLAFVDMIPALLAGNTVVLKPSEITPLTAQYGLDMMREAGMPSDVVQVVNGPGATGAALVDVVDYVMFTGSTAVGRKVAVRAAERLVPYSLELGGKDPFIVLADADLDKAAAAVLTSGLENTGQACVSTERVYVESPVYDAFLKCLLNHTSRLVIGADGGWNVHVGSLTNKRELVRIEEQIADALAKGARVLFGGQRRPDLGPLFFEPTILVDVDHTMQVMQEETFGPLIPIMRVADADEAVRLANDSEYGLSGCIYTRNIARGTALAQQINTGDISINRPLWIWSSADSPMGGQKNSGLGRRNGKEGLMRFVITQTVTVDWLPGLLGQDIVHLTPRLRLLILLRRALRDWLPFVRP